MAANTMVALDKKTIVNTTTNSIEFTNIPQNYSDLRIVFNGQTTAAAITVLRFNNTSGGTDYSWVSFGGSGSSASSNNGQNQPQAYITNIGHMNANQGVITADIMGYSNTNLHKKVISFATNAVGLGVDKTVSSWRSKAAVTSIQIYLDRAEYWSNGSTFSLYGIAATAADTTTPSALASGGTVSYDKEFIYHKFTGNGTFTPSANITNAEVLVVAGGGGGGWSGQGGGGAGGVIGFTGLSLASGTGYTCSVGAGGPGNVNGTNSQFGSLQLAVGGGAGWGSVAAQNGGSGGGSQGGNPGQGFAGPPRQGNNGSNSNGQAYNCWPIGGGGGAGTAGFPPVNNSTGGYGGEGTRLFAYWAAATSSGDRYCYAGGGGGGTYGTAGNNGVGHQTGFGGIGGGGNGNTTAEGTAGMANTGGGGGAGRDGSSYIPGGSGIIIVRYPRS